VVINTLSETGRLLGAGAVDLSGHLATYGPPPTATGGLVGVVEAAGLTGRGGAGFPTHRKLAAVAAAGGQPVVIANAAEGEPASAKDRTLLARSPHLVLDGLQLAAGAVGSRQAHLYLPAAAAAPVTAALAQRRAAGLDRVDVAIRVAADTFVAGEESAVVAAVSGGRAVPRDKTRRVVEAGVGGAPTLVQNVETLAQLALIARYGPAWFRAQGTAAEPGTFLATVSGSVGAPGVYELPYGAPLGELVTAAGGPTAVVRAVLVGGYHGAWVPANPDLPLSRAGLAPFGATPGAGVVIVLPSTACGLVATARAATYLAGQTAGQCGPCVNGLPRLADTLAALAHRRPYHGADLPTEVQRLAALVTGRGACRHPDGTVRLIRSALSLFATDVTAHLSGHCLAA
jgi:NADH:ubiquinone oxidoreductase subunit F (NADH-binding)